MLRGAVNPIKFVLASFPTMTATSVQLFGVLWQAINILEYACGLKVCSYKFPLIVYEYLKVRKVDSYFFLVPLTNLTFL